MDFIVGKFDMVFIRCIPFLENNLSPVCTRLCRNKFLKSANPVQVHGGAIPRGGQLGMV
jgi:hypothetical protein